MCKEGEEEEDGDDDAVDDDYNDGGYAGDFFSPRQTPPGVYCLARKATRQPPKLNDYFYYREEISNPGASDGGLPVIAENDVSPCLSLAGAVRSISFVATKTCLSRQRRVCRDKTRLLLRQSMPVAIKIGFCRDKRTFVFVATKLVSRQK